jgi:acyl carrier protein
MTTTHDIERPIRDFILTEFLPGENPEALTPTTPLMTSGILDSIATLKLVAFLEQEFAISMEAYEANADHLDTLASIVRLVAAKKAA